MATEQSVLAVIRAARPTFRNAYDKITFAVHSAFLSSGFVLHATGPSAFSDDALSSSSTDEVGIDNWNQFEDSYAFVYSNPEKDSKKVLVKCLAMNDKLLVDVLKEGDSEPLHVDINVGDYVVEDGGGTYSNQYRNLGKLVSELSKEVLDKLSNSPATASSQERGGVRDDTRHPRVGIAEPEPDDMPSNFLYGYAVPPVPTIGGFNDLVPGPGAGTYPSRGGFGGGSMLVGPNDPRFFGGLGEQPGFPGGRPGIPPGARFDPIGPPGVPGFEPGRFIRDPRRPGGGRTHPDLEHFGGDSDFI